MDSFLWIDVETTGLNEEKCDIIELACVPIVNGIEQAPFHRFCKPLNIDAIDAEAVRVHGISIAEMLKFDDSAAVISDLINYLQSFNVKFVISGFNVSFDKRFLYSFFKKNRKTLMFTSLFDLSTHDTYVRAKFLGKKELKTDNLKLSSLCESFGINIDAHHALSDISATIKLDAVIGNLLGETTMEYKPSIDVNNIVVGKLPEPVMLHVHSQFSVALGVPTPEEWIELCLKNSIPGLSVTDHGVGVSLYRSIKTKEYIKDYNKKHNTQYDPSSIVNIPGLGINFKKDGEVYSINAWAISNAGYFNLVKLSSIGLNSPSEDDDIVTSLVTLEDIYNNKDGLIFGTAGVDGYIGKAIVNGDASLARQRLIELKAILGDLLMIEFIPVDITRKFNAKLGFIKVAANSLVNECNTQKAYNQFLSTVVDEFNLKCIPTTSACFIDKGDIDVQRCIQKNQNKDGFITHESYHYRDSVQTFKDLKVHLGDWLTEDRYISWVHNTYSIMHLAKDIDIKFEYHLPKIDIPDHIKDKTDDYDKQVLFLMMDKIAHHGRWNKSPVYIDRFKKELDVILKNDAMSFIPYFLIYEDLGSYARSAGFLQNIARGSAGGSLLSYYLKIIHVDPIKADLPFERFLSHARIRAGSWPDIDMDISQNARPYVMRYLKEKYGLGFAQIATFSTIKTKNAIKDAFGGLYDARNSREVLAVCDTIPDSPQGTSERDFLYGYTDKEGEYHQGELERNSQLRLFFDNNPEIKAMVDKLIGTVRGWSRHASAFVISTIPLGETRIPTMQMYDKHMDANILVTQYEAKMVESVGLVKADILGLKTLSVVTDTTKLILASCGKNYLEEDNNGLALLYRLPEDNDVYEDFYNKQTDSSFQFNTDVVKGYIQEFKPCARSHNMALTALLRPGAMDVKMTSVKGCEEMSASEYYMQVRSGKRLVEYIHPDLEPILKESNGVVCYQEEVMRFLVDIVGYSHEESDTIRSAIAKKKHDVMMASFDRIRDATSKRGWTVEQQQAMCDTVMAFSRYSFNKSHAYAYAELGYITMYLKHHHPIEWWTAVLNHEDEETKVRSYISLLGNLIRPPSLSHPTGSYIATKNGIISPISAIKSVGPKSVEELCSKGPYTSISDLCSKVNHTKVNIGVIGQLIKARAADDLMDRTLPYEQARRKFMDDYKRLRGKASKTPFKEELNDTSAFGIYMMERETNTTFNRTLLSDTDIVSYICSKDAKFLKNSDKGCPMMLKRGDKLIKVLSDSKSAKCLIKNNEATGNTALVLLYKESAIKKGLNKHGKPYVFTRFIFSDGVNDIEGTYWNYEEPVCFSEKDVLCVIGTLNDGWKTEIGITIQDIRII